MPSLSYLRDPTSETSRPQRSPIALPKDITGKTIALLDISKERSDEFIKHLSVQFQELDSPVKLYRKASHSKPAARAILQAIVQEADMVIEGLAD